MEILISILEVLGIITGIVILAVMRASYIYRKQEKENEEYYD